MNEEEKEAIEYIKELIKPPLREEWDFAYKLDKTTAKQFKTLLSYIDRLQKELENADERNYSLGLDFIQIGEKLGLKNFGIQTILLGIDKLQKENETLKHDLEVYKNRETNAQKACGKLSTLNKKFRKRIKKQREENLEQKKQLESRYYHTLNARELENEINNNWEDKIRAEIKELEEMDVGGELFETAVNFAIKVLKELLN